MSSLHHSFDINLAIKLGSVDLAILVHHFQHWIAFNKRMGKNFKDGHTWTYQSRKEICARFPYWNYDHVKYLCEKLVKMDVLKTSNYNKSKIDKTLWYAFSNECDYIQEPKSSNNVYEGQKCPSMGKSALREGKSAQPIPDTKPDTKPEEYKRGPKAPSISADAESLYIFFLEEIKKRFPNFKQPNKEKWLLELDRLLRIDKRSLEEIKECILWIENDNWFKANILSPSSLRKSYDKIYANMLAFKDKNRIRENREWAIKQKELHKEPMKSLSFDKDFARNVSAGKEIPFNLPIKSFREALIAMFGGTYRE